MFIRNAVRWSLFLWLLCALASACTSHEPGAPTGTATRTAFIAQASPAIQESGATATPIPASSTPRPTDTPAPISTATPTASLAPTLRPTRTPTLRPSRTPTPVACADRMPDDGLYTLVTRDFGLSREYVPGDLAPLADYFGVDVTLGYPTEVRAVIVEPLQRIVEAMKEEGLRPQIVSGYRSYSAQSVALQKWRAAFPDWAAHLSAPPGHSEHQLGTTVDFGSPELQYMLGEDYVQFHPAFAQTSEGQWLAAHAPEYGFTMSYPDEAFERTSFYFEPWHFRYVGPQLAKVLADGELTISEYLMAEQPVPCLSD